MSLDEMVQRDYRDRDGNRFKSWDAYLEYCRVYGKRVAATTVGDVRVSTVWLGLDHQYGNGPSLIFETMTFGGKYDCEFCRRYSDEEDALRGHLRTVERLRAGKHPDPLEDQGE